jgi:hypothetical protein
MKVYGFASAAYQVFMWREKGGALTDFRQKASGGDVTRQKHRPFTR